MDMEGIACAEEFVGSGSNDATHVAKGKRIKRLRSSSPSAVAAIAMTSSCSSASGDHLSGGADYGSFSFSSTTSFEGGTDQEAEDMANCLILLAQGGAGGDAKHHRHNKQAEDQGLGSGGGGGDNNKTMERSSSSSRRFAEMATATTSKIDLYIYECKTCNRTFHSFQALGGHRASHKKAKVTAEEKKPPPASVPPPPPPPQLITNYEFEEAGQPHIKSGPPIPLQLGCRNRAFQGNKSKIHECSICGSEFASGQALGGHMRRHRASANAGTQGVGMMRGIETSCDAATADTSAAEVRPRNVLQLDLNLPAPEDDLRESKFQLAATQKSLVLSAAPALVGCHY